jgi:hypothetical protein
MNKESNVRTNSNLYNNKTNQMQLIHEQWNTAYNHHTIIEGFENKRFKDIADELKVNEIPAIILGSGASLDKSIKYFKDWKGGIFCTTSQALTLMYYNIEPDYIVALDPFCSYKEIEGIDWSKTKTKLIAHPGVFPDLIKLWPNEVLMYIENVAKEDSFYSSVQKRMFSFKSKEQEYDRNPIFNYYIRTEITIFACSPPIQIFCASLLGYKNFFLCGCDFAYVDGKERFTNYIKKEDKWIKEEHLFNKKDIKEKKDIIKTDNGLYTHISHLYYKKNLFCAWRLNECTLYTTDHGAITEIPYISIQKLIKNQGKIKRQTIDFVKNTSEKYLNKINTYIVETVNGGKAFVEVVYPAIDLMKYMAVLNQKYTCPECKMNFIIEDYLNHIGMECPNCKKGKLIRYSEINIEDNCKRFIKLLKSNKIKFKEEEFTIEYLQKWEEEQRKKAQTT